MRRIQRVAHGGEGVHRAQIVASAQQILRRQVRLARYRRCAGIRKCAGLPVAVQREEQVARALVVALAHQLPPLPDGLLRNRGFQRLRPLRAVLKAAQRDVDVQRGIEFAFVFRVQRIQIAQIPVGALERRDFQQIRPRQFDFAALQSIQRRGVQRVLRRILVFAQLMEQLRRLRVLAAAHHQLRPLVVPLIAVRRAARRPNAYAHEQQHRQEFLALCVHGHPSSRCAGNRMHRTRKIYEANGGFIFSASGGKCRCALPISSMSGTARHTPPRRR